MGKTGLTVDCYVSYYTKDVGTNVLRCYVHYVMVGRVAQLT